MIRGVNEEQVSNIFVIELALFLHKTCNFLSLINKTHSSISFLSLNCTEKTWFMQDKFKAKHAFSVHYKTFKIKKKLL